MQLLSSRKNGASTHSLALIPMNVWEQLTKFLLDKKTGNIQLNVKDGRVLGIHLNEIVSSISD